MNLYTKETNIKCLNEIILVSETKSSLTGSPVTFYYKNRFDWSDGFLPWMTSFLGLCLEVMTLREAATLLMWMMGWLGS